jgi:hypothetical protein
MSIYDSLLASQQQGLQTQNANQMQIAQMPTFADKFLAGLRSGQQMGMQQQMQMANMNHLAAQNQNYKDQRINQEMAAAGKYADPTNAAQFTQRIQDLGGPQIDFSSGGSQYRGEQLRAKLASDKNQIESDLNDSKKALNEARIKGLTAQIPVYEAQVNALQAKADKLNDENDIMTGGDTPLLPALIQSRINRNNQPLVGNNPGSAPIINATTKLNQTANNNAMGVLKNSWMMSTPTDRAQKLIGQGIDPGTAKVLALSPTLPADHPGIQGIIQKQFAVEKAKLQSSPTPDASDATDQ